MKLISSFALIAALSIAASSAFAASKTYTFSYGQSPQDSPTRITVTDNSGDPIHVSIPGGEFDADVMPDGPNYILTIRSDEGGYTDLVITDNITGRHIYVPHVFDHDDVNVHPGLNIGVGLKK